MGQCVSRKAGAVIAASGYSPSYRIMEKKASKKQDKNSSKRGQAHTRGTAISFGFRRRAAASAIPVPVAPSSAYQEAHQQRSKSAGPERESRGREQADEDYYAPASRYQQYSSSGRSTPRLAPPKKESSGLPVRVNRFGFRNHQQSRFTDKVADTCAHNSHASQDAFQTEFRGRQARSPQQKARPSPVKQVHAAAYATSQHSQGHAGAAVSRYTLHSSSLPQPQYAVRMGDVSSKIAKTAANQSRKVGGRAAVAACSSKEGSGTEDSGVGSQHGGYSEQSRSRRDYCCDRQQQQQQQQQQQRPRRLGVVVSGKSFDVRDVDDERHVVTEISVIPLPKNFAVAQQLSRAAQTGGCACKASAGLVRERASQYQRASFGCKDNRYADSSTSMSTTSSEGYDEGLGEEKAYKDRSRSEKLPASAASSTMRSSDFSPGSSDEQDEPFAGHGGEAMADEYSLASSSEDFGRRRRADLLPAMPCNTVTQTTVQHFKAISNAAKSGALPNSTLRSVLLTIEDPAFAAVAATTTTLIDDETSPVDSLFDSPTASVSQAADAKPPNKEASAIDKSANTVDDDSPGTPTNASNSLSLSEGREFFDDEIADQPGLVFDETLRETSAANTVNNTNTNTAEHSQTVLETAPKMTLLQRRSVENSPVHGRTINRVGSVSTLSSCESLASDDLMMDYERSDASSFGDISNRGNSTFVMKDLDDATSLLDLEIQGQDVMRDWNSLLTQSQQSLTNSTNNNVSLGLNNNQNTESGLNCNNRTAKLLNSRSSSESPRSLDSRRTHVLSPLRTPRNIQSPNLDSGDEGSLRIERGAYNYMFQDIVSIKTMLLKLKRVLQESGENGLTRSETLNPFDNTLKNGLFYNLNDGNATTDASLINDGRDAAAAVADELADLRRQVVFLQGQVDDKDRTIKSLQAQLAKYQNATVDLSPTTSGGDEAKETCNAATQTEKLRPVSTGPSILQSLSQDNGTGSLVSWNDSWSSEQQQMSPGSSEGTGRMGRQSEQDCSHNSLHNGKIATPSSSPPSRRSSSDSSPQPAPRPNSLRGLKLPNGFAASPSGSPKTRSAIPAPRSRLATPTLIPRAARALSTGRAHNT